MKKIIVLIFLLYCAEAKPQNLISFKLDSINKRAQELDSMDGPNLITPKTIVISANPMSNIIQLCSIEDYSIGVQFEILQSKLENTNHLVFGIVFYKKKKGTQKWDNLIGSNYSSVFGSDGKLGFKGLQIASSDFRFIEDGPEYFITYELHINGG